MSIDLTGIIIATIGGFFSIVGTVFLAWLQAHMKDQQAAAVISTAVKNSLGAMQQAADATVSTYRPQVQIPGVPANMAVGVQYVLDNAGPELARYTDITPARIADKISAQIGLANIATNVAVAGSASPEVPAAVGPTAIPARTTQGTAQ